MSPLHILNNKTAEEIEAARMKPCKVDLIITNSEGYEWIERGEMYTAYQENDFAYYIKVFGTAFHVLKKDVGTLK